MTQVQYTSQLGAGLGMLAETNALLDLWVAGMTPALLYRTALESGRFPGVSARRLRNLVVECFSPRLLNGDASGAAFLKVLRPSLATRDLEQMLLVYTCRANTILGDFIRQVYWPAYCSGRDRLSNQDAREFVVEANQTGMTTTPWSAKTIQNVAGYLTGACAEFGLLERGRKAIRRILPFRIEPRAAIALAYDLHFSDLGDNTVVAHPDWSLFGLERAEVVSELRRLSLKGVFLVQSAGDIVRIGWQCKNPKELSHAISQG